MKIYQQLAATLAEAGVSTVFGVLGDGNMHWVSAYRELPGCRWRPAWHEAGAVWMADGYAAATGRPGVVTVTMGPGLAQSLAAMTTAVRTARPVLLVTADQPAAVPAQAQQAEQRQWVDAAGARYLSVHEPAEMLDAIDEAFARVRDGHPCVVAVDVELFTREAETRISPLTATPTSPVPAANEIEQAAGALGAARAPLVVLGRGATAGGPEPVQAALDLGRRAGAAFATTLGGRAALPGEAFNLGVVGMMADPLCRQVCSEADVVLVLGAALDRYNTDGGSLGRSAHHLRLDSRPPQALWSPAARTTYLTGQLSTTIAALHERLGTEDRTGLRTEAMRSRIASERVRQDALASVPSTGMNPWAAVAELDAALPADAFVVIGIGHFWYYAAPYLRPGRDRRFHFGHGFGLIGQALPLGVGVALGLAETQSARQVVAIEGDGSVTMNIQELQAAVRHGADLLLIVLNNQAYGSEYYKLALAGLDVGGSEFSERPFDVVAIAEAMGARARRATDMASLRDAVSELLSATGMRVLDVHIAREPMSEAYERQHGRQPSPSRPR